MTKDEAKDLKNLHERVVETQLDLDRAMRAKNQAERDFEMMMHSLTQKDGAPK